MSNPLHLQYASPAPSAPLSPPKLIYRVGLASIIVGCLFMVSRMRWVIGLFAMKTLAPHSAWDLPAAVAYGCVSPVLGVALLAASVPFMMGRPGARRWVVIFSAALSLWLLQGLVRTSFDVVPRFFHGVSVWKFGFVNYFNLFISPFLRTLWPLTLLAICFRRDVRAYFDGRSAQLPPPLSAAGAGAGAGAAQDRARAA